MPDNRKIRGSKRLVVYMRDNGACLYCGELCESPHIDHIIPRSAGGTDKLGNLATACATCNVAKGDGVWEELKDIIALVMSRPITEGDRRVAREINAIGNDMAERYEMALDWKFMGLGPIGGV